MRRALRTLLSVALVPVAGTLVAHQAFAGAPLTTLPRPVAIAAYEHVGTELLLGVGGPAGMAIMAGGLVLMLALIAVSGGGLRSLPRTDLVACALVTGGAACNATEVLLRGSVLDWLWISIDGRTAIATNVADAALVAGGFLLVTRMLVRSVADARQIVGALGGRRGGGGPAAR